MRTAFIEYDDGSYEIENRSFGWPWLFYGWNYFERDLFNLGTSRPMIYSTKNGDGDFPQLDTRLTRTAVIDPTTGVQVYYTAERF